MRLGILAIGRLKSGAERVLVDRYLERLKGARGVGIGPIYEKEFVEARAAGSSERRSDEATRLLKAAGEADILVALDEAGEQMTSAAFAAWLGRERDRGARHAAFLIGGPDGQGEASIAAATLRLSLGAMTLPHGLARAVLAEQLYRATTILLGHPYHRA